MHIAYFEQDGTTRFLGYLSEGGVTNSSEDVDQVRKELDILNKRRSVPLPGSASTRASFVQALVMKKIDIEPDGSLKSSNYFPETFIVEIRVNEAGGEKKSYAVLWLKNGKLDVRVPTLNDAVFAAEQNHKLATVDPSTFQAMAAEAGLTDE
ncbi:hypothetical protein GFL72_28650 [Rhizobium leguminosarum bv. viciae]|uniref:hypothetical protein n=1 Tax=Rhizobium leguminosarum TaxID=384 RepID=UPI001442268D|nr:hypothetical protein [Rhizobium leguminosarum]NKK38552.1 hypothetical protein [Rhizobium leguminosarum bv. viciae]